MICSNCGFDAPDGSFFCTNCGAAFPADDHDPLDILKSGASKSPDLQNLGSSLEAAVEANKDAIDSIEARAQAQVDAAFEDFPPINDETGAQQANAAATAGAPEPPIGAQNANAPQGAQGATPIPVPLPTYQQAASPNAHYSSQRTYESNAYGQDTDQPYQQPSYGYQGNSKQQESWAPQTATNRAYAMVIYAGGLLGVIFALCVRDKDNEFITHHLNNAVVILIGSVISFMLSIVLIGGLVALYLFVMWIMGIVSAYNGDMKELPLIGKIRIIK